MLRLRFDDFTRASRSHTLSRPTARTDDDPGGRPRRWSSVAMPLIRDRGG